MKFHSLKFLVAAGLCLIPSLSRASVDSNLTLELRYFMQQKLTSSGNNDYGQVKSVRLNAKQLLIFLAQDMKVKFPDGAMLRIQTDDKVVVTDSAGNFLRDASAYFELDLTGQQRVFDGQRNRLTGQEASRNYFPITFKIKLSALKGTVKGIAIENLKTTNPNGDGVQITTGQIETAVNGSGTVGASKAYYDGSLYLKGRKATVK